MLAREGVRVRLVDELVDVLAVDPGPRVQALLGLGELGDEHPGLGALVALVLIADQPRGDEGARHEQQGQQTTQH